MIVRFLLRRAPVTRSLVGLMAGCALAALLIPSAKGDEMSYKEAKAYLDKHTKVLELTDGDAVVAVCPEWQGRVMTSSCKGPEGASFGFICKDYIDSGEYNPHFANYGAEDRFWLSPEGGQFSLWFKPGAEQNLTNWFTPPVLNEGPYEVVPGASKTQCRMTRKMEFENTSATKFKLGITRDVCLLGEGDIEKLFGEEAAALAKKDGVKKVGYVTVNTITNEGAPMDKAKGLVSIWILGMLNSGPETVVVVPYKAGSAAELGPVVKSDYFGEIPPERLKITPEAILFSGDAKYRSKIGTSQKRAKDVMGSYDFGSGTLTIVKFSMPKDPTQCDYMNNSWVVPQEHPYVGDVANSYNDGPPAPGKKGLGDFYEVESLSPAVALDNGESLTHRHRTFHFQGPPEVLAALAKEILGVDLETVKKEMIK